MSAVAVVFASAASRTRANPVPRWSVVRLAAVAKALLPPSSAGLPASSACVCSTAVNPAGPTVWPPLFASATSRALTFNWLFAPVIVAPVVLPMRLKSAFTAPMTSSTTTPDPRKFPSTIVFCSVTVPALRLIPPPVPVALPSESARLFEIVTFVIVVLAVERE